MKKYFTSLNYGSVINLMNQAKGQPVELWYVIVKTTPGLFKLVEPTKCRVKQSSIVASQRAVFQYQSQKGNWLSTEHYSFKNNAYYFLTKEEAEEVFKILVDNARTHFKEQIIRADSALDKLKSY